VRASRHRGADGHSMCIAHPFARSVSPSSADFFATVLPVHNLGAFRLLLFVYLKKGKRHEDTGTPPHCVGANRSVGAGLVLRWRRTRPAAGTGRTVIITGSNIPRTAPKGFLPSKRSRETKSKGRV